eukprot:TRINITY_DN556_c0_g1_i1.p1 TRINITY_DN556_c0_g1~~TRINITY_DN556_c0_g1_i1.p1  ORF type:complete len:351 (-),score=146.84 TRINITY_DN556_c0_g1_i1:445-1497(-)
MVINGEPRQLADLPALRGCTALPPALESLHLKCYVMDGSEPLLRALPATLSSLQLSWCRFYATPSGGGGGGSGGGGGGGSSVFRLPPLPEGLTSLTMDPMIPAVGVSVDVTAAPLQPSLTYLHLANDHGPVVLQQLPQGLRQLVLFCTELTYPLPSPLPPSLLDLNLYLQDYEHALPPLPPALVKLQLWNADRPLPALPPTLLHLALNRCQHAAPALLPPALTHLSLHQCRRDDGAVIEALPDTLTTLELSYNYQQVLRLRSLPPALEVLKWLEHGAGDGGGSDAPTPVLPPLRALPRLHELRVGNVGFAAGDALRASALRHVRVDDPVTALPPLDGPAHASLRAEGCTL